MIPARPSATAQRVAMRRAAHQLLDHPPVLVDPLALRIVGAENEASLHADPSLHESGPLSSYLRAFLVARSRFAEDQVAHCRDAGCGQYVILGAGLDTFAYRASDSAGPLRVWEVDHPSTQAWKRRRLEEAGIPIPPSLTFVPTDFEGQSLDETLSAAGFDRGQPACFSWLGVTVYLTRAAVMATLAYVAGATSAGGGIVFDYGLAPGRLDLRQRLAFEALAGRVRAAGEPWQTFFEPEALVDELRGLGFAAAENVSPDALNARYFADRADGLQVGSLAHVMWAGSSPASRAPQGRP